MSEPPARSAPQGEAQFQELMEFVDNVLRARSTPIHAIELAGLQEISLLLKVEQHPMQARQHQPRPGQYSGLDLTARAMKWFKDRYGDRLKSFDPRPGRVALLLRSQIWILHLPLLVGRHVLVATRGANSGGAAGGGGSETSPVYNIVDALEGGTPSLKNSLTDEELRDLMSTFETGMAAYLFGRSLSDQRFVPEAITDHEATVNFLAGNDRHPGQARWAALQAAEKMLKSCIALSGKDPARIHNLHELSTAVTGLGLVIPTSLINRLQVGAAVRYGEVSSSVTQGVSAHHASLEATKLVAVHMRAHLGRGDLDWSSARQSY